MTLEQELFGVRFQNPVLLAAGTCGFGEELAEVVDLERLGGLVTKSVTREPRAGNPAPRVAEFHAGMLNSIGLANPGVEAVRRDKLPWLRDHVRRGLRRRLLELRSGDNRCPKGNGRDSNNADPVHGGLRLE